MTFLQKKTVAKKIFMTINTCHDNRIRDNYLTVVNKEMMIVIECHKINYDSYWMSLNVD